MNKQLHYTKEDLEKMGGVHLDSKMNPNKFFVQEVGEMNLYEPHRLEDIFQSIYSIGFENGTRYGEAQKIGEIKRVLNIEDGQYLLHVATFGGGRIMTNAKLVDELIESREVLYKRAYFDSARAISEAIRLLTIYDRPPTVDEVGDGEECMFFVGSDITHPFWMRCYGANVRYEWCNGDRWMYLQKVAV